MKTIDAGFSASSVRRMIRRCSLVIAMLALLVVLDVARGQGGDDQPAPPASPSATGESFAKTFFVSRATHSNGEQSIDIIGSMLLWTLISLSVVNFGLIGFLSLANQGKTILPAGVVAQVRRQLGGEEYRQALELTRVDQSFFSQVLHAGLSHANQGPAAVMRALEQTADLKITQRMRPIEVLYMFGQVSPMIGLLGTVYGIIYAFRVFVSMGGHASPALLAGGIGTALVATFWGLVVAIPALAAYSMLRNKVDQLSLEATMIAEELVSQFKSKPPPGGSPSPKISTPSKVTA